jgi:hypothetical protein
VPGRRRQRRHAVQLAAKVLFGAEAVEHAGELLELSEGGMLFLVAERIPFGAVVRLRFRAGTADCAAAGRVLRTGRRGVAVELAHANAELVAIHARLDAGATPAVDDLTIDVALPAERR